MSPKFESQYLNLYELALTEITVHHYIHAQAASYDSRKAECQKLKALPQEVLDTLLIQFQASKELETIVCIPKNILGRHSFDTVKEAFTKAFDRELTNFGAKVEDIRQQLVGKETKLQSERQTLANYVENPKPDQELDQGFISRANNNISLLTNQRDILEIVYNKEKVLFQIYLWVGTFPFYQRERQIILSPRYLSKVKYIAIESH